MHHDRDVEPERRGTLGQNGQHATQIRFPQAVEGLSGPLGYPGAQRAVHPRTGLPDQGRQTGGVISTVAAAYAKHRDLCRRIPRLHLEYFPAYAPELNPDEAVWALLKGKLAKGRPDDIRELEDDLQKEFRLLAGSQSNLLHSAIGSALFFALSIALLMIRPIGPPGIDARQGVPHGDRDGLTPHWERTHASDNRRSVWRK